MLNANYVNANNAIYANVNYVNANNANYAIANNANGCTYLARGRHTSKYLRHFLFYSCVDAGRPRRYNTAFVGSQTWGQDMISLFFSHSFVLSLNSKQTNIQYEYRVSAHL